MNDDEIYWRHAVFAGACLGGIMWAIIVRLTIFAPDPQPSEAAAFTAVSVACAALLAVGATVARWLPGPAIKTAGASLAIAPMTGGLPLLVFGVIMLAGKIFR